MLAVIGGTGLSSLAEAGAYCKLEEREISTPWGEAVNAQILERQGRQVVFLPRHGPAHQVPPHRVNYRANIAALAELGVKQIVAANAVGGIHAQLGPGCFAVPEQIIDYTWGRQHSFFEDELEAVVHVDFTHPFDDPLRSALLASVAAVNVARQQQGLASCAVLDGGVYGVTQGPRLETAAEIQRLRRDGCDMVGMTAMPEAALAREKDIAYAMLAQSVNWAAGLSDEEITMEQIRAIVAAGMDFVLQVLEELLQGQSEHGPE